MEYGEELPKAANVYVMTTKSTKKGCYGLWVFEFPREDRDAFVRTGFVPLKHVSWNEASLLTLIAVLSKITEPINLTIYIDNTWVSNMARSNLSTWAGNDYRSKRGEKIKNAEEWKLIYELFSNHLLVVVSEKKNHQFKNWMRSELKRKEKEDEKGQ